MAKEPVEQQADDQVLSRLWDVAHKYQRLLKRGQVVPLGESEGDRLAVAPFAEQLRTTTERNLDGMTYRSLAEMQVRRDTRRLLSNLPGSVRLRRLGFEVSVRGKPVVFLHGPTDVRPQGLLASVNYQAEEAEAIGAPAGLLAELDESEHRIEMRDVGEEELERLQARVRERLVGRRFKRGELASAVTSAEADLLSQLSRRGEIEVVMRSDGGMEIREGKGPRRRQQTIAVAVKPKRRAKRNG